jgi:predicted O-linked N-acetylglucosamine transferase (SPINDLY family)
VKSRKRRVKKTSQQPAQLASHLLSQIQRGHQPAVQRLQELGRRYPKDPVVCNALGCLALERGEGAQALDYLHRAHTLGYPNQREQQRNRLIAYALIGDEAQFATHWQELSAASESPEREIAVLRSAIKAARATEQVAVIRYGLQQWRCRAPDDPALALSEIGLLLYQQERAAALDVLQAMPPIPASDGPTLLAAAQVAFQLKHPASLNYFQKACEVDRDDANYLQALISLGGNLNQFDQVIRLLATLLERWPDLADSKLYDRLNIYQQANRWDEVERLVPEYLDAVRAGRIVPKGLFRHLSLPGLGDAEHLLLAHAYLAAKPLPAAPPPEGVLQRPPRAGRPLRIGYLSADFKQHPVAQLLVEVLERHDRQRFTLIGYDIAEDQPSLLRDRVLAALDEVVPVRRLSDAELIERIRADHLDILVDLQGDTSESRVWLLRARLAPIQVGWLGFPGGLGQGINDYILADAQVIPATAFAHFAEQPVWLPDTYIPNDPLRQPLPKPPRLAHGLPETAIVWCCFNGQYKITREMFHAWCRIMQQVEDSILWLRKEDDSVMAHFRSVAGDYGIAPERLIFAPRTHTQIDHLTRLQCADIALDTRPYNAHTTSIDALWARLPVITLPGESFASRVACSILHVAGFPEWIARDIDDYIAKAVALALDRPRLQAAKQQLEQARTTSVLYDAQRFVNGLEQAFEAMYARFEQGLAPAPICDLTVTPVASSAPPSTALSVELLLENAHTLLYKEQLGPAQQLYHQVLAARPDQPAACHGLGLIHGLRGDYTQALAYLDRALAQDPDNARYQQHRETLVAKQTRNHAEQIATALHQAQRAHQAGDLAAAICGYDQILEHSPRHPKALHYKGLAEVQQGQAVGLEKMRDSVVIQPHNQEFLHNYRRAEALLKSQGMLP